VTTRGKKEKNLEQKINLLKKSEGRGPTRSGGGRVRTTFDTDNGDLALCLGGKKY